MSATTTAQREDRAAMYALSMALAMGWEILWPLILGFALSTVVQAIVSHREMSRLLPDNGPRSIGTAIALGAASSSCSYAAVALARSLFRKGANFTAAMAFELASTNLVLELGIILTVLMGWQFTLAEFVGGPIMVILLVLLFRALLNQRLVKEAKAQADKGLVGRMEGHAEMDMSVTGDGTIWQRIFFSWNYTTWLNIAFLAIAAFLVRRFLTTGGPEMLRMMNRPHDAASVVSH